MKNLVIILFIATICGCAKTRDLQPNADLLKTEIVGNWTGTKNVINYTNTGGNYQTYDNLGVIYNYKFGSDGTAVKTATWPGQIGGPVTTYNATYTITTTNGVNYLNLTINIPGTSSPEVDTYKIVNLSANYLELNGQTSATIDFTDSKKQHIVGTNATVDEAYTK